MATISIPMIGNMALSHIGTKTTIETLDDDKVEAKHIKLWYDYSRLQILEAYDWSFARTRIILATHSEDPPEGVWAYRYQYPSDCVAARHIVNPFGPDADAIPFEVETDGAKETKTILTDMNEAVLAYTFDLETVSLFTAHFVEALSHLIAYHVAYPLTRKNKIKTDELQVYQALIRAAPAQNANERVGKPPRDAEHIRLR